MAPRRNYNKIPVIDRTRLRESFNRGEAFLQLVNILEINRTTAYSIVNTDQGKERGGNRQTKVDYEMKTAIADYLESNPLLTLNEINFRLGTNLPQKPAISIKTLSRSIDGLAYTLKLNRDSPAQRNATETLAARKQYAEWILSAVAVGAEKIYVVDFGVNIHTKRSFGRALRGETAIRVTSIQSGRNVSVCAAISAEHGLIYFEIFQGSVNSEKFRNFLQIVSGNIITEFGYQYNAHLIFDNAPSHRNVEYASGLISIKRLPKYSPFLNPIEIVFSSWKAAVKKVLASEQYLFINIPETQLQGRSLILYRFEMSKKIIEDQAVVIDTAKCKEWHNSAMTFIPRCIVEAEIL